MSLRKSSFLLFLLLSQVVLAENYPNLTNTWISFQSRKAVSQNFDVALDGGMRLNDNFIQNLSQALGRVVVRRKLGDRFFVGGGYAFFAHFSPLSNTFENRPFVQANFETYVGKSFHKFRLRNEWRDFTNREDAFRMRMQYYLKTAWKSQQKIHVIFSAEQFYTFDEKAQHETRIICGIEQKLSDSCALQYVYIFRNQYSNKGLGHIFQLNFLIS
jgi:hypothetical protein